MTRTILHVVILLISLAIIGCANETRESILRGDANMVNNNFCDAVTNYRKALSLSPDRVKDQKLDANLKYAKKECSKSHYREGTEYAAKHQLDEAANAFKTALTVDPDNKKAQQALEQSLNIKADNIMTAVDNYQDGEAFAAKKDWRNAVKQFNKALVISANIQTQEQIDKSLQKLRQAEGVYNASLSLLEKKKWSDAIGKLGNVLAIDPAHPDAPGKILFAKAAIAAGRDRYLKGEDALKQGNRVEAAGLFKKALQEDPEQTEARNALTDLYYRIANELTEKGNAGNAVLFHTKALSLQSNHKGARSGMAALEDEIRQRITCNLALLPLREYSRDPELSNALYTALRNKILAGEKGFVKIIDNKPLEKLAEEKDVPVEKLNEGKNITLLKTLPGVNAVLTGKVATFKISSEKKAEKLSKKYQSGTDRRRNPEYDRVVENARLANQAADAARRAASQAGFGFLGKVLSAATDVSGSIDIANTPEYVEEPVFSTWHYKINHHKKKAEISVSFRLLDTQTGELLADESIPAHVEFSADSVENPNPGIGIEDKPLPFESDDELKSALILKATDQIAGKLTVTMHKYAKKYLLAAQGFDAKSDRLQAVENYMNFVYAVPTESPTYVNELKKARAYLESVDITN
jgi:tetratricopeptide (TPR) repeat protein